VRPAVASKFLELAYWITSPMRCDLAPGRLTDINGNMIAKLAAGIKAHRTIHRPAVVRSTTYREFHALSAALQGRKYPGRANLHSLLKPVLLPTAAPGWSNIILPWINARNELQLLTA
jgi:hypothetical protein